MGSSFSICPKELTRLLAVALSEPLNRSMDQSHVYPTISVVVPSYNHAPFLRQALDSVLLQDYPRLELIVVDGGSTDGSVEILRSYSDRLTRWVSEPDRGQTDAINRGIAMAGGEIVAWLNSDDLYLAGCLESAGRALQRNPGAGMVYGDGVMVDSTGNVLDHHRYRSLGALDLLCFDVILQPAAFMRRRALDAVGGLDDSYNLIMDHDLWVRLAARFPIAQATVSHHLRILGESGLVAVRREGQHSYFSVVPETIASYRASLEPLAPARRRGARRPDPGPATRGSGNIDS